MLYLYFSAVDIIVLGNVRRRGGEKKRERELKGYAGSSG